jgi:hypothetical protein
VLEKCACKYFSGIAIKKNISVGLAQIKISTAQEALRDDPYNFIKKICDDKLNIEVCGKLLREIINEYNVMLEGNSCLCDNYEDIYDYIACEYIGASAVQKDKRALIKEQFFCIIKIDKIWMLALTPKPLIVYKEQEKEKDE